MQLPPMRPLWLCVNVLLPAICKCFQYFPPIHQRFPSTTRNSGIIFMRIALLIGFFPEIFVKIYVSRHRSKTTHSLTCLFIDYASI